MAAIYRLLVLVAILQICKSEFEIEQNSFKLWRQVQKTTQRNHIKLQFKTIHATGLIMFARGANKADFLAIELYRGKIRVAGNYANGTMNALRPISGQYDMYAGKDLADNQWHTVEFIRNIRQSIIYIDRNTVNEKMVFSKSPPTFTELSVSMVTFGGYFSFAPSEISTRISKSRKGIKACFKVATFSQDWRPETENGWRSQDEVNFMNQQTLQGMTNYGTIKQVCEDTVPPYRPLFFSSSPVHIALVQNYSIPNWKLSLKFRTVINEQILANYTTINTGKQIMLQIDRQGRVVLKFDEGQFTQFIETSKENFHDGEWHSVAFNLPNVLTPEQYYEAQFTVDGKTRLAKLTNKIDFEGHVNIGFGFTGCMRDILVNDQEIHKIRRNPEVANDFFQINDVGVIYNSCSLKDYCNPNPCMNGGKCNQTDDNIVCNCKGTLYEGSTCHRPRFNYTCAGVRKAGERRSDVYYIDMDGMGPMKPIRALCDLGKTVETTVTQINNTRFQDVDVTSPTQFNDVDINYEASITQMRELIMNSDHCQQYIKYTCKGTPLFLSPSGPPKASWMGGDDIMHFYWGGAKGRRGYCACGIRGDCMVNNVPIGQYCNCDSMNQWQQIFDEGNFTIKEHLPVRQVQFKSVLKGSVEALLRVGHLRCSGFGSHDIAATFRKPYSYLSVYHPDQPLDNVQAGGISFDFKTSQAFNYMTMAHAVGPFSGNYIKIMIWTKTMVRVHLNLGFGDLKQDVDISTTGRTLDDNEWHELNVMFNLKELNVTLDGVHMIQGIPLQEDPVFFNLDATPLYVGGSYHDIFGYVGCIRSLYVNGRIFDIKTIAQGQEDFGVYPGCGSACPLLNRPCNYGQCYDEYDSFRCNCSVSPYDGEFCQNETYPKLFGGGNSIVYDLKIANQSKPIASGIFVFGFKTTQEQTVLGQIIGNNSRHFTLALRNGYLTLYWNLKNKDNFAQGSVEENRIEILQINKRKLNIDTHQVVKLHISTQEIWIHASNYNLSVGVNVTETKIMNEANTAALRLDLDTLGAPSIIQVGSAQNIKMDTVQLPNSFQGCMSGAKFVYTPVGTPQDRFPDAIEIDFFELISVTTGDSSSSSSSSSSGNNPALTGTYPSSTETCGPPLKIPGELPTVGPERQFYTKSPGLDLSVRIPETDWVNQLMIVVVILIVAVVLLGLLYIVYKKINKTAVEYHEIKKKEYPEKYPSQQRKYVPTTSKSQQPPTTTTNAPFAPVTEKQPYPEDSSNPGGYEMQSFDTTQDQDQGMFL